MGINYQALWMSPLANTIVFAGIGVLLIILRLLIKWLPLEKTAIFCYSYLAAITLLLALPGLHPLALGVLAAGLAVQTLRWRIPQTTIRSLILKSVGWLAALVSVFAMGALGVPRFLESQAVGNLPIPQPNAPNVLLIVLDTVRADSLSLYGYSKPNTPNLEQQAKDGVLFTRAIATSSWTLPSHASMFTGHLPNDLSVDWVRPLDATYPTLAEILRERGYRTAGFVGNLVYGRENMGLARGFIHYDDYPISVGQVVLSSALTRTISNNKTLRRVLGYHDMLNRKSAKQINTAFLDWLERQGANPYFAFLNYFDAHEPYLPPKSFAEQFGPKRVNLNFDYLGAEVVRADKHEMSPAEIEAEIAAYDGAIAYLDDQLASLFDTLNARGDLNDTLVIVVSDHGEQFGEHGLFDHGNSLYWPVLHVPLLILFPGRVPAGTTIHDTVSLVDLPATILDLAGLENTSLLPGQSLASHWRDPDSAQNKYPAPAIAQVSEAPGLAEHYPAARGDMLSSVLGSYHYILNGDSQEELYNLDRDSQELSNLTTNAQSMDTLAQLRDVLMSLSQ